MNNEKETKEETELDKEFRKAHETAMKLINEKLGEADEAMAEAVRISKKYGIPFTTDMSPGAGNTYIPELFTKKFESEVNPDILDELECYCGENGWPGWQTSYC